MMPDTRSLRDLLADAAVYGRERGVSDGAWRELLLARQPRRARPRAISRARDARRLILFVALPVAAIVLVALIATFGMPTVSIPAGLQERVSEWSPPAAPSLLSWPRLSDFSDFQFPGGNYLWLLPLSLSALLTLKLRRHAIRILPMDW